MDQTEISIKENLSRIQEEITEACNRCGRNPQEITLVGVSKTKPASLINSAIDCGLENIGENYVQDLMGKYEELKPVNIHFIGHLQSNKAKYIVPVSTLIHSVDSISLLKEINKNAKNIGKCQKILLEINIGEEETKFGINKDNLFSFIEVAAEFTNIKIEGLMGMAPFFENPECARPYFAKLKNLFDALPEEMKIHLSMGMSGDFRQAVYEGSTMVRIGTAIFGKRNYL